MRFRSSVFIAAAVLPWLGFGAPEARVPEQPLILRWERSVDWSANASALAPDGTLVVKAGETTTIGPIDLGAPDAKLVVRSTPAGADVSVDGVDR